MTDVDELSWTERNEAERLGRMLADKHGFHPGEYGSTKAAVDAMVELLGQTGVALDGRDEAAMRAIVASVYRAAEGKARTDERQRILTALGTVGARLSAAELAAIGRPSDDWWFSG